MPNVTYIAPAPDPVFLLGGFAADAALTSAYSDLTPPSAEVLQVPTVRSATAIVQVTDAGLRTVILLVTLGDGRPEWVWDGVEFSGPYAGSRRELTTGGWIFRVSRVAGGGWPPGRTSFEVRAHDHAGNEV